MTTPASGTIHFNDLASNIANVTSVPISLNNAYVRELQGGGTTSGQTISMNQFYSKIQKNYTYFTNMLL